MSDFDDSVHRIALNVKYRLFMRLLEEATDDEHAQAYREAIVEALLEMALREGYASGKWKRPELRPCSLSKHNFRVR